MNRAFMIVLSAASVFAISARGHGQGSLIAGHFGAADPQTEGFSILHDGNPSLGPVIGDLGMSAWSIQLGSPDIAQYSRLLTAEEQAALTSGWIMSLSLRVLEPYNSPNNGISAWMHTGTQAFGIFFGAEPNGDPMVQLGNSSYTLFGGGAGYHYYQLKYNSEGDVASLWVDGTERLSDLTGTFSPLLPQFLWGGGQHPSESTYANWNEASVSLIPEPSAVTLLLVGGGFLLWIMPKVDGSARRSRIESA